MTDDVVPVLIVGGGPVGLSLGIDLHHRGVRSLLVDQSPREARAVHPRMDQVGLRTMEIVRRWGEVPAIFDAGFPRDFSRDIVFVTGVLGYELEREPVTCDADRPPPPFSPEKHELCPQNFFDPALQRIADRSTLFDVRYGVGLVGIEECEDRVRVVLRETGSGEEFPKECRYLVACDGADSFVARTLGMGTDENTVLAQSTNIFLRSAELTRRTKDRQGYRYILMGENGIWGSMANISGRDVWRVQLLDGDGWFDGTEKAAHAIIEKAIGQPVAYELMSIVPWIRRELLRDRFSQGRCFLVGDAAHQLSPTGGYGMNTGIAEAADLSWKLAATLSGWGGPDLLASYDIERRPVALRAIKRASVNFARMTGAPSAANLMAAGPDGEAVRDQVGLEIRERMSEEWDSFGIHLGFAYTGSPLVVADEGVEWTDDPACYRQSSIPGARAPHAWLSDGRSTLDLFGDGFVLLVFADDADPDPLRLAASDQSMPLTVVPIRDAAVAALYEKKMVLVRPDGHVAWRGDVVLPADAAKVVATVRGARQEDSNVRDRGSHEAAA